MKRRVAIFALFASGLSIACSGANLFSQPGFGAVIRYELAKGAKEKFGLLAVADTEREVFASATLRARNAGNLSFVGAHVPKWIRVTWRTPIYGKEFFPSTGKVVDTLDFGEVVGDYKVKIASRIPSEVFQYASRGRGRAIYLVFRIKDDGVLLSWSVQETVRDPKTGGTGRVYSLYGGDLSCDDPGRLIQKESCTSGYLKDAPWYDPSWEFI